MVVGFALNCKRRKGMRSLLFGGRCGEERMDGWMGLLLLLTGMNAFLYGLNAGRLIS
jgi:hypothetical protein